VNKHFRTFRLLVAAALACMVSGLPACGTMGGMHYVMDPLGLSVQAAST